MESGGGVVLDIGAAQERLREFATERDWQQFHTPKNIAMALSCEAGELLEIFQWLTPEESKAVADDQTLRQSAGEELADILQYTIRLADLLEIDLSQALYDKLDANRVRYPIDVVRGRAMKMPNL